MHPRPQLETARLRFRPYAPDDVDALHRLWTDPSVRRYLFDDEIVARAIVLNEITQSTAQFAAHGYGQWCIFEKETSSLIGFGGYRHFGDPPELQLLYGFAPHVWGRGYATEAARALIRYGFEVLGFDVVVACADVPNTASQRVLEKAGLIFRKQTIIDDGDVFYYTLPHTAFTPYDALFRVTWDTGEKGEGKR